MLTDGDDVDKDHDEKECIYSREHLAPASLSLATKASASSFFKSFLKTLGTLSTNSLDWTKQARKERRKEREEKKEKKRKKRKEEKEKGSKDVSTMRYGEWSRKDKSVSYSWRNNTTPKSDTASKNEEERKRNHIISHEDWLLLKCV